MKTLALTGGMGSGKSYVRDVFSAMGIPTYDTDRRVKELYDESSELKESVSSMFGKDIYTECGLNRKALAEKVFYDKPALRILENMVYPVLLEDVSGWKNKCADEGARKVLIESALILEKECFAGVADVVITVSSPESLRISRAMERDNCSVIDVAVRIRNQHSDLWREQRSDYIIVSDGKTPLIPQIVQILSAVG